MKKTLRFLMVAVIAISVTFTSCKKSNTDGTTDTSADLTTHSDDQARFDNETDEVDNEANVAIENYAAFQGRVENVVGNICGATVEYDTIAANKVITITYNGLNCWGNRFRTGVVTLSMPVGQNFSQAGATITATATNLKITRVVDNKSVTINGVHQVKNVTGGRLAQLASAGTIVHEISTPAPGMSVTFDNGSQRTWMVAKKRTFTYDNGIKITTIGTHTEGNTTDVAEWGTNRFGNPFVTAITQPMVIRQDCNFRLVSGQVTHSKLAATVVVTFGLDSAGNPTTCPAGVFYFKLVWTGANGIVRTLIWPY